MKHVFLGLAWGNGLVLLGAVVVGMAVDGDRLAGAHLGLAVFAGLLTCLTHAVVFTYFTATGKMIRQAVFIGHLNQAASVQVAQLKRSVSRWVGPGVLSVVTAVGSGAFILHERDAVALHRLLSLAAVALNIWAFRVQFGLIVENCALLARTMGQYAAQRREWARQGGSPVPRQAQAAGEVVGAEQVGRVGAQSQGPRVQEAV